MAARLRRWLPTRRCDIWSARARGSRILVLWCPPYVPSWDAFSDGRVFETRECRCARSLEARLPLCSAERGLLRHRRQKKALGMEIAANTLLSARGDFVEGSSCAIGLREGDSPLWVHASRQQAARDPEVERIVACVLAAQPFEHEHRECVAGGAPVAESVLKGARLPLSG